MAPSGFPTGTVSSGRSDPSTAPRGRPPADGDTDPRARIAELERENEALRAAVERQRRENDRIVERYEQLLDCDRAGDAGRDDGEASERSSGASTPDEPAGVVARVARLFTYRG